MKSIPMGLKATDISYAKDLSKQMNKTDPAKMGKFDAVLKSGKESIHLQPSTLNQVQSAHSVKLSPSQAQEITKTRRVEKVDNIEKSSPLKTLVGSMARSENQLNNLVDMGLNGKQLSNQELLTMQAGVYKATITIDVVSKGVEQTTGGFKTVLQAQV